MTRSTVNEGNSASFNEFRGENFYLEFRGPRTSLQVGQDTLENPRMISVPRRCCERPGSRALLWLQILQNRKGIFLQGFLMFGVIGKLASSAFGAVTCVVLRRLWLHGENEDDLLV
jgi:hypothetical protein